jgi:hypothetical protein
MHLPLVFYLRMPVPMADSPAKLEKMLDNAAEKSVQPLIIVSGKEHDPKEPFPRPPMEVGRWKLMLAGEVRTATQLVEMYRVQRQ